MADPIRTEDDKPRETYWQKPEDRGRIADEGRKWLEENAAAIASYNKWVEENELPLAQYRRF